MACYKVLTVPVNASPLEIRSAYRKLAMKWHPERNPERQVTSKIIFTQLAEAYEILSDFDLRIEYDIKEGLLEVDQEDDERFESKKVAVFSHDPFLTLKNAFSDCLIRGPSVYDDGVFLYDFNNSSEVSIWQFSASHLTKNKLMEAVQIAKIFPMHMNLNKANGIKQYSSRSIIDGQIVVKQKVQEDGFEILLTFVDGVLKARTIFDELFSVTYTY